MRARTLAAGAILAPLSVIPATAAHAENSSCSDLCSPLTLIQFDNGSQIELKVCVDTYIPTGQRLAQTWAQLISSTVPGQTVTLTVLPLQPRRRYS